MRANYINPNFVLATGLEAKEISFTITVVDLQQPSNMIYQSPLFSLSF